MEILLIDKTIHDPASSFASWYSITMDFANTAMRKSKCEVVEVNNKSIDLIGFNRIYWGYGEGCVAMQGSSWIVAVENSKRAITAGLEPAISGSVDRCLIQFGHATRIFVALRAAAPMPGGGGRYNLKPQPNGAAPGSQMKKGCNCTELHVRFM